MLNDLPTIVNFNSYVSLSEEKVGLLDSIPYPFTRQTLVQTSANTHIDIYASVPQLLKTIRNGGLGTFWMKVFMTEFLTCSATSNTSIQGSIILIAQYTFEGKFLWYKNAVAYIKSANHPFIIVHKNN